MKVLLVKPPTDMHVVLPPIGLGYLASYCRKEVKELDLRILDCHREKMELSRYEELLKESQPDIIGFTALSMEIESALRFAERTKEIQPDSAVIIGGPHASAVPEKLLENLSVDYIFTGEAEIGFAYFLNNYDSTERFKAPGLVYRFEKEIIRNEPVFIDDLDSIPFPDYEGMQFEKYPKMYFMRRSPAAPIMSSRGCPYSCTFCAGHKVSGRKWRARSVGSIISEIKYLSDKYGIREVDFWDDNFTLDRKRVLEFCKEIRAAGRNIIWWCPNGIHLNTVDKELLTEMKASGCYAVAIGVEAGSEKIQRDMKKNISFDKLKEIVEAARRIGLRTQGFFIIGYPTENREDILKTIELAKSLPFLRASLCLFQPIIGSEIYEELVQDGSISRDAENIGCDYSKTSIPTKHIKDISELKRLQKSAILQFYRRPKIFSRLILENLTMSQIKEIFKILRAYIFSR